jgi:hypothetical protein
MASGTIRGKDWEERMSRHWKFKTMAGPTGGYYTLTYENTDASTTAEMKLPELGVYHGKPQKKLKKKSVKQVAKKINKVLNKNT